MDKQHTAQQGLNEAQDKSTLARSVAMLAEKERQNTKTRAPEQSPSTQSGTPMTPIPSLANKQSTASSPALVSSRQSSREDREESMMEIRDGHNSPDLSRHDGKKARVEERGKRDTDGGALIVRQQSGDGDLFGGTRLTDEWETPISLIISLMKREKGRQKKINKTSEQDTTVSLEDHAPSWTQERRCLQPIMEPAHLSKIEKITVNKGPLAMKRKPAQAEQEKEWEDPRPNAGELPNKKSSKKKQGQLTKKKLKTKGQPSSLKSKLFAVRRKRKTEAETDKAHSLNQSQIPIATRRDGSGDIQLILPVQHSHQYRSDNSSRLLGSRRILRTEEVVFLFTKLHSLSRVSLPALLLRDLIHGDMAPEYVIWGHLTFTAIVYNSGLLHRRSLQERARLIFDQVKLTLAS
ncbi:hypothetical protein Ancab_011118 [Ancistrocladus abbreviatus]